MRTYRLERAWAQDLRTLRRFRRIAILAVSVDRLPACHEQNDGQDA